MSYFNKASLEHPMPLARPSLLDDFWSIKVSSY